MKLSDLYQEWLEVKIFPSPRSEATLSKYHKFGKIIQTSFPQDIQEIKPSTYQRAFNEIGKSTGRDYSRRIHQTIKKVVQFGIADGIDIQDFTVGLEIFAQNAKKLREEKYLHSLNDFELVLDHCKRHFNYTDSISAYYLYLLFQTGLRPGELLGLTWDNVYFQSQEIHVENRVSTITLKQVPPKNSFSIRTLPVNSDTVEVLQEIKEKQALMLKNHHMTNPDNLVFVHWNYKHTLPTHTTLTKSLKTVLDTLKITPRISLYGARHTKLSVLLANGVEMAVVARYAGHVSNEQIIKTYGGLLDEIKTQGFEQIRKI